MYTIVRDKDGHRQMSEGRLTPRVASIAALALVVGLVVLLAVGGAPITAQPPMLGTSTPTPFK